MSIKVPNWYRQSIFSDIADVQPAQTVDLLESELQQTLAVLERRACNADIRAAMAQDIVNTMKSWFTKDRFLVNSFEHELIGSSVTGLAPNTTNIDISIYNPKCNYTRQECVNTLKRFQSRCPTYLTPRIVTHTLIPYLEFQCPYNIIIKYATPATQRGSRLPSVTSSGPSASPPRLVVNVTVQNYIGNATTRLLQLYTTISPFFSKLCLITRYWASQRNLLSVAEVVPVKNRDTDASLSSPSPSSNASTLTMPSTPPSFCSSPATDDLAPHHLDYTISPAAPHLLSPLALSFLVLFALQCQHILPAAQCRASVAAAGGSVETVVVDGVDASMWCEEDVREKWELFLYEKRCRVTEKCDQQSVEGETAMGREDTAEHVYELDYGSKSGKAALVRGGEERRERGGEEEEEERGDGEDECVNIDEYREVKLVTALYRFFKLYLNLRTDRYIPSPRRGVFLSAYSKRMKWTAAGSLYKAAQLLMPATTSHAASSWQSGQTYASEVAPVDGDVVASPTSPAFSRQSLPRSKSSGKKTPKNFPQHYFPVEDPFCPTHDMCELISVSTRDRLWLALSDAVEMMEDGELPVDVLLCGQGHKIFHKLRFK